MSADKREPSLLAEPKFPVEIVESTKADRAPMCPYCLGKGAYHYPWQADSLMCSQCLGTGTVQR